MSPVNTLPMDVHNVPSVSSAVSLPKFSITDISLLFAMSALSWPCTSVSPPAIRYQKAAHRGKVIEALEACDRIVSDIEHCNSVSATPRTVPSDL